MSKLYKKILLNKFHSKWFIWWWPSSTESFHSSVNSANQMFRHSRLLFAVTVSVRLLNFSDLLHTTKNHMFQLNKHCLTLTRESWSAFSGKNPALYHFVCSHVLEFFFRKSRSVMVPKKSRIRVKINWNMMSFQEVWISLKIAS